MKPLMKYFLFSLFFSFFIKNSTLAQPKSTPSVPTTADHVLGLVIPILLTGETTEILLNDCLIDTAHIKNTFVSTGLSAFLSTDKKSVAIKISKNTPLLSNMFVETVGGKRYDFLLKQGMPARMVHKQSPVHSLTSR